MNIRDQARVFMVWREGNAVSWDCSYSDLARAAGCHPSTARAICLRRGWKLRHERTDFHDMNNSIPVDHLMSRPSADYSPYAD